RNVIGVSSAPLRSAARRALRGYANVQGSAPLRFAARRALRGYANVQSSAPLRFAARRALRGYANVQSSAPLRSAGRTPHPQDARSTGACSSTCVREDLRKSSLGTLAARRALRGYAGPARLRSARVV